MAALPFGVDQEQQNWSARVGAYLPDRLNAIGVRDIAIAPS